MISTILVFAKEQSEKLRDSQYLLNVYIYIYLYVIPSIDPTLFRWMRSTNS